MTRVFNIELRVEVPDDCDSFVHPAEVSVEAADALRSVLPEGAEVLDDYAEEE